MQANITLHATTVYGQQLCNCCVIDAHGDKQVHADEFTVHGEHVQYLEMSSCSQHLLHSSSGLV
jgi:hypothetical protein